ncbi:MAG: DNA-directed RNA polymerase subunit omega [Clostridia bacterium]|nr:DNA-directed RNA polymerase subunit omega [Clostridia bacterium]
MIYPPIAELLSNTDSQYTLAMEIAKRARQITAGSENRSTSNSNKSVTIAVQEIYEDKVSYHRTKEGIK